MPGPSVTVHPHDSTPQSCTFNPLNNIHAPKKSQHGFVNFNATAPCTITFDNRAVFGTDSATLNQGNNQIDVEADPPDGSEVTTLVFIQGCPTNLGAAGANSGPTDIIVP
jgi:hypothetical protein